jgi:polysaccharide deacetylase family protein (PEP-CTERM system associated)
MTTPTARSASVVNAITIDVEDYFQVSAFAPYITRSKWEEQPQRVEQNIDRTLEILEDAGVHATFFTLGWIANRYPEMIRRIVAQGHELASHGYAHERASSLQRDAFFADVAQAKSVLEDVAAIKVRGYRAPSFSIGKGNLWAYECLAEAGYDYSSSVYPIRHDHYGSPDAPRFTHSANARLLEVPITTARLFRQNWPAGGGGYFRLMPYTVSRWLIQRVNVQDGESVIFYFHPWEIDPDQPRVNGVDAKTRFRHYVNLHRTAQRLRLLLRDFHWDRLDRVVLGIR